MHRSGRGATVLVSLAVGVLIAFCLPTWFVVCALCAALIWAGCCMWR